MNFILNRNCAILITILFIVAYKYWNYKKDKEIEDEIFNNNKSIEPMFPLNSMEKLKTLKKLEITELKKTEPQIFIRYGNNNNHLINDGRHIYQNAIKYLDNRIIFCGYRYGLASVEWHKSVLNWKDQEVGLELHLLFTLVESKKTIKFVIPLSLVDLRREKFF